MQASSCGVLGAGAWWGLQGRIELPLTPARPRPTAASCAHSLSPLPAPSPPAARAISNTAGTLSGVVGVPATGYLLQWAGGADKPAGWWEALSTTALQCVAASFVFLSAARGERLFGGDTGAALEAD